MGQLDLLSQLDTFSQLNIFSMEMIKEYMGELFDEKEKERWDQELSGIYCKEYMESRMQVLDRACIAPVAVIYFNINDSKFVLDHFGKEQGDSLVRFVASAIRQEAQGEYVVGRMDKDVFLVLIPLAEQGEAEVYCRRIQEVCLAYDGDDIPAPSVASGIGYKTNVEECLQEKLSDAEYEMLKNKLEMKQEPGYEQRLRRPLGN